MFCPKCRTEYREGFSICVDCNSDLVDELPSEEKPESVSHIHISPMFYVKTIYLILYLAFGVCLLAFTVGAGIGGKTRLFGILIIYTFLWWVMGGAAFLRPNKSMKYFIAIDLIAFLYFFYNLFHEPHTAVWSLLYMMGLSLEAIVSYMLLKKSMLRSR